MRRNHDRPCKLEASSGRSVIFSSSSAIPRCCCVLVSPRRLGGGRTRTGWSTEPGSERDEDHCPALTRRQGRRVIRVSLITSRVVSPPLAAPRRTAAPRRATGGSGHSPRRPSARRQHTRDDPASCRCLRAARIASLLVWRVVLRPRGPRGRHRGRTVSVA